MYCKGGNIIEYLKSQNHGKVNPEAIMISYDLQAGSYTELASKKLAYFAEYTNAIASVIRSLGAFKSIMEIGVGEATVMNPLMKTLDPDQNIAKFGFDISWSRVRYAVQNCQLAGIDSNLFVSDLFEIPLADDSIDIVYTSHSLEPNGGKEKDALAELYRVAKNYVVLLEPDFNRASAAGKERMLKHGYVRDLASHAHELGYEVVEDRSFEVFINNLNPTGLTVIKKKNSTFNSDRNQDFVCPVTKAHMIKSKNVYFCEESGLIYPAIDDIPCLIASSATLGTHFIDFAG